ncbi:hypothetical protein Nepgr_016593 [Nepenthes gracilis]|uniref:Protein kinase domain-containing protein n=1 Tax=Nepenthes gracilis TaxID=150966 RepID=A0AAD3SPK4_NEPGR|nr:hypothetical protein Nepgr_016593 [Nepenthes gracilis]
MMIFRDAIDIILFVNFILTTTSAANSALCNQSCGFRNSTKRVNYPFGFSGGCKIQLNCSVDAQISLGEFLVRDLTSDSIMIDFPGKCNRPVQDIEKLFDKYYALTWQNGLLLQNCTSQLNGCMVPASLLENRFALQGCDSRSGNISCYAATERGIGILSYENVSRIGCKFLFSSVFVNSSINGNSDVSLEFQMLQLGWWLTGECRCSKNANCTTITLANGSSGHRCQCTEGFIGDGFADGEGCRKACDTSKYISGHCGGTRVSVLIGGIIAAASSTMVVLVVICYFIRRHSSSSKSRMSAKRLLCEAAGSSSVPLYPFKDIERATNGFSEEQKLGTGAYGTVYAGKIHDECVAVKKIKHRDTESIEQVMNEIKLLSSVSHPNLVRLLGCCIENGEQILVYEYMPNGTLSQHLQRERGRGLPWTVRLTIAAETAEAIAYLHSAMNPPIYHRDIKSSNILLDFYYKSKVADFGLSRLGMTEWSHISTAPQGTPGYVDPEYNQNFHLSDKSDVYSFGVVLVEIVTGMKAVDFSRAHSEVNLAALAVDRIGKGRVDEIIDPFLEPHRDAWTLSSIHKIGELAFRCLAYHGDMRPSMMEVAEELQHIRMSGWASLDDNINVFTASSCSSPSIKSERSHPLSGVVTFNKEAASGRLMIAPQMTSDCLVSMEQVKDSSPVSVQDSWPSEQSSPSTNSLLGNVIH